MSVRFDDSAAIRRANEALNPQACSFKRRLFGALRAAARALWTPALLAGALLEVFAEFLSTEDTDVTR